jgi:uncharacterized protein
MDSERSSLPHAAGPVAPLPSFGLDPPGAPRRLALVWRLILFLAVVMAFGPAIIAEVIRTLMGPLGRESWTIFFFYNEAANLALLFGLSVLVGFFEGRTIGEFGLPGDRAFGKNFWLGFLFGLIEICVLVGLIAACSGYSFGPMALHGRALMGWGLFHLVFFLLVGLYEEFAFRGYPQFALSQIVGFWPAAILLAVGFGAVHLPNRGENWVGALGVAVTGFFFAFTLHRTGNLWYAIGLHASFDWGETFLFSVPNSGTQLDGYLSYSQLHGPAWLTGGTVGPEASVFAFVTMGLQFLVAMWLFPRRTAEPGAELPDSQTNSLH